MKVFFIKGKEYLLFLLRITQQCSFSLFSGIKSLDKMMVTVKKTRGCKIWARKQAAVILLLDMCEIKPVANLKNLPSILSLFDNQAGRQTDRQIIP